MREQNFESPDEGLGIVKQSHLMQHTSTVHHLANLAACRVRPAI